MQINLSQIIFDTSESITSSTTFQKLSELTQRVNTFAVGLFLGLAIIFGVAATLYRRVIKNNTDLQRALEEKNNEIRKLKLDIGIKNIEISDKQRELDAVKIEAGNRERANNHAMLQLTIDNENRIKEINADHKQQLEDNEKRYLEVIRNTLASDKAQHEEEKKGLVATHQREIGNLKKAFQEKQNAKAIEHLEQMLALEEQLQQARAKLEKRNEELINLIEEKASLEIDLNIQKWKNAKLQEPFDISILGENHRDIRNDPAYIDPEWENNLQEDRKTLGLSSDQTNLLHLLESASAIQDNDSPICFQNGVVRVLDIAAANGKANDLKAEAKKVFLHLIKETYGIRIANILNLKYQLENIDTIKLIHLKAVIIGAAANVKQKSDLCRLFNELKFNKNELSGCAKYLKLMFKDNPECIDFTYVENFEDLTPDQITTLLSAYRTFPSSQGYQSVTALISEEEIAKYFPEKNNYHFVNDAKMVHWIATWNKLRINDDRAIALESDPTENKERHAVAVAEYLGKSLAYIRLEPGMVIPVPDRNNNIQYCKVVANSKLMGDGVLFYLLAPLNKAQDVYQNWNEHNIHLLFRGTNCSLGTLEALASLRRDLTRGIGKKTFENRKEELINKLDECVKQQKHGNIVLNITGHSLGGVDTQRALATITETRGDYSQDNSLQKISAIKMITHNSPYGTFSYSQRFAEAIKRIGSKITNGEDRFKIEINHLQFASKNGEGYIDDVIQKFGGALIGADVGGNDIIGKADFVKRRITDIKLHKEFEALARHGVLVFSETAYQDGWELSVLKPESEAFEKRMAGNYHWSEEGKNQARLFFENCVWYTSTGFREIAQGIRTVLDNIIIGPGSSPNRDVHSLLQ